MGPYPFMLGHRRGLSTDQAGSRPIAAAEQAALAASPASEYVGPGPIRLPQGDEILPQLGEAESQLDLMRAASRTG